MRGADGIVVNSNFTKAISKKVFPSLEHDLGVIYPCVDAAEEVRTDDGQLWEGKFKLLLSINRFERKKDIALAIKAYSSLSKEERHGTRLVIAGGYDQRVNENVQYHQELEKLATEGNLMHATAKTVPTALAMPKDIQVLFLLSIPDAFKTVLLQQSILLLYTPKNEHFGIVPVEAMKYGLPVLASNTGGPLETILDGKTGWLRDVDMMTDWVYIIRKVLLSFSDTRKADMSRAAKVRVQQLFTRDVMAENFEGKIEKMLRSPRPPFMERETVIIAIGLVGTFLAAFLAVVMRFAFHVDPRATEFIRVDRSKVKRPDTMMPLVGDSS